MSSRGATQGGTYVILLLSKSESPKPSTTPIHGAIAPKTWLLNMAEQGGEEDDDDEEEEEEEEKTVESPSVKRRRPRILISCLART